MSSGESTLEKSENPGYGGTGFKMRLVPLADVFGQLGFSHGLERFWPTSVGICLSLWCSGLGL